MSLNDEIVDNWITQRVDVLRTSEGIQDDVLSFLKLLEDDIRKMLLDEDISESNLNRISKLLTQVRQSIDIAYGNASSELNTALLDLGKAEQKLTLSSFNQPFETNVAKAAFTIDQLRTMVDDEVDVVGVTLEKWWKSQEDTTRLAVEREIRVGHTLGKTNKEIVEAIVGKPTGKRRVINVGKGKRRVVRETTGGVFQTTKREAITLVRTSTMNLSNQVIKGVMERNDDLIRGYKAIVTFDGRTSKICMARSGGVWSIKTGRPLAESTRTESFPGFPPWHPNCRTMLAPIVKSWNQLVKENTQEKFKGLKRTKSSIRASMDGSVPGDFSYNDFLRRMEEKKPGFALEKLGPARYQLWKANKITTHDLIDMRGNTLTVEELLAKVA